jgi:hypothetical protein
LDIDYIFKWVHPTPPEQYFSFWVAPCTLIFKNALQIKIDIDTTMFTLEGLQIDEITFTRYQHEVWGERYIYTIELHNGTIELHSEGFSQVVRQLPMHGGQSINTNKRGGISFSRVPTSLDYL